MATLPTEGQRSGSYVYECRKYSEAGSNTNYASVDRISAYGSDSQLFGAALTPADVNSPEFGVTFNVSPDNAALVRVDSIKLTIYYEKATDRGTIPGALPTSLSAVTLAGPIAVAVGAGGKIFSSSDQGATWTERDSTVTEDLFDVVHGDNQFVAVGQRGVVITSPDGVTWTRQASPSQQHLYGIIYSRGKLVAVGSNDEVLFGTNTSTWEPKSAFNDPYVVPT